LKPNVGLRIQIPDIHELKLFIVLRYRFNYLSRAVKCAAFKNDGETIGW
jgi:hypothetical protein